MRYKFLCEPVERLMMACIGGNGKVIFCDTMWRARRKRADTPRRPDPPGAGFQRGARGACAQSSGRLCNPSHRDVYTTKILFDEFARGDEELIDHVIVAPDGVYSMREGGMLPTRSGG
jgi:hypothetical protein